MNDIFFTALIISVVEFVKNLVSKYGNGLQLTGNGTIVVAGVTGAILGYFGAFISIPGVNPAVGFALGLAAAGVHQVATAAGGK